MIADGIFFFRFFGGELDAETGKMTFDLHNIKSFLKRLVLVSGFQSGQSVGLVNAGNSMFDNLSDCDGLPDGISSGGEFDGLLLLVSEPRNRPGNATGDKTLGRDSKDIVSFDFVGLLPDKFVLVHGELLLGGHWRVVFSCLGCWVVLNYEIRSNFKPYQKIRSVKLEK